VGVGFPFVAVGVGFPPKAMGVATNEFPFERVGVATNGFPWAQALNTIRAIMRSKKFFFTMIFLYQKMITRKTDL
jgi:hypothetical protein